MSRIGYFYDPQEIGEDGFNDGGIHSFTGSKLYEFLTREICQNSLDASESDTASVKIKFQLETLPINNYPELFGLKETIAECKDYWKDRSDEKCNSFFKEAKNLLDRETIDVLIISDYNTKGAVGAKNPEGTSSKWRALTSSNGVTENNQGSGGAYGIGKNAPFACSLVRTIFYNTFSRDDKIHAFQGTSKLVTHTHDSKKYKGYGFCWDIEEKTPVFEMGISPLMDHLNRTQYGTDVVIAGFKNIDKWDEIIEQATINNFFIAIANKRLEVEISGRILNSENLKSRMEYYASKEVGLHEKDRVTTARLEYYEAFIDPDYKINGKIIEDNDVVLYIKKDDSYSKTVAEMRAIGMVVKTRTKNIFTRYAAVVTVQPGQLNNLLKKMEPPTHDDWDSGLIEDSEEQKYAEKKRKALVRWVNDQIVDNCRGELQEEFDLEGVSAYLPFDEDDPSIGAQSSENGNNSIEKSNSLESNIHALPTQSRVLPVRKTSVSAQKVKGTKDPNIDPHNSTSGGHGKGHGGHEDPLGAEDVTAIKEGSKSANIPKIIQQRIIGTLQDGRYVALFKLEKDCPVINISIQANGDDNRNEALTICSYKLENGKEINIDASAIQLTDIVGGQLYKVFISLKYKERLKLVMNIG